MIWFGDLNYRISMPESKAKALLAEKRDDYVLTHDQVERPNFAIYLIDINLFYNLLLKMRDGS